MSNRKRLLSWGLGAIAFSFCFLFGAVAVDPLSVYQCIQETRLDFAGARREVFAADDGTSLSAFVLGPLSAERPVVLLHGLGADATYWAGTARFLARRGRTVILPDAPGSGRSDAPREPEGYGLPGRLAALDALARALALEKFDLVGHSLGGWTAGWYALKFPWKTRRLVLVDAGGLSLPTDVEAERARVLPTDRAGARRIFDLLFFRKPAPSLGFVLDAFGRNYGGGTAALTVARLTEADGLSEHLGELPEGTTLIWGEKETLFPLEIAREAAARMRAARLVVLGGAGHDGPLETPAAFQEALLGALDPPVVARGLEGAAGR
ncbi:MAG TPA: alpha/beta fold hydrolase [Thermoanaerobaculia bacterium]|nr:alpha/beta fold hydrolase [Thermoanaerobaculia bacterium]